MTLPRPPGHTCPAIDDAIGRVRRLGRLAGVSATEDTNAALATLETVRLENSQMRAAYYAALNALDAAGVEYERVAQEPAR